MDKQTRKEVEDMIYTTLSKLEVSGMNAEMYKKKLSALSDKDFLDYFKKMKNNEDFNFYVEIDLYGKNEITLESIEKAAAYLKVPLEEYVYIKHKSPDGTPIRSAYKVPVMYVHMKRMQQLLSKKVKSNVDIGSGNVRSRITGSLNSTNKSGRFTDMDSFALTSITTDTGVIDPETGRVMSPIMQEVLGARADNLKAKSKMLQDISLFGHSKSSSSDTNDIGRAVRALDIFMLGAGLKTDLVTKSLVLKQGEKE